MRWRRQRRRRAPLLAVNNIEVIYDHVILVLKGVSLRSPRGASSPSSGPTARARSTTLKAISGLLRTERGEVTKGTIELRGRPIQRRDPSEVVQRGVVQVMEGRHVFEHLTVEENLLTGRVHPAQRRGAEARPRSGVYVLSRDSPSAAARRRGLHFGRRAADAGHRPRAHGPAPAHAARRAVDGAGPHAGGRDLRDREPAQPGRGRGGAARRAERHHRPRVRAATAT